VCIKPVIVAAALAALVSIVVMLIRCGSHSDPTAATAALAGVSMAWARMHLMYAARYAYLRYTPKAGGIDFNSDDPPGVPGLLLLQLQPGHDVSGVRHQRLRSDDFYRDIFSCRVAVQSDDMALLLTSKGFQIYLHVNEPFLARNFGVLGVQHLVWSTDSESDLEQIGQRLQAYDPATYTHTDAATGLTFLDACGPDAERIIITHSSPRELPRTAIADRLRN